MPDATPDLWKQPFSAVRASGGYPGNVINWFIAHVMNCIFLNELGWQETGYLKHVSKPAQNIMRLDPINGNYESDLFIEPEQNVAPQGHTWRHHYCDVLMGAVGSQTTNLMIVYSTVYSDADQRKHQSSASLAFVRGIHRGLVNSPHKWPVTRKCFHLMTSSW